MNNNIILGLALTLVFLSFSTVVSKEVKQMGTFQVTTPAFENNGQIPSKFTCDGSDVNPQLVIHNTPSGAKSLAMIVDDPDAPMGTWVHWVVWNISPQTKEIRENTVPEGAQQGINDFRKQDYGGPCPPSGTHRYFFKLYALDSTLTLDSRSKKADLEKAMKKHVLAETQIIGLYKRK
jgi:Raf kinase inhibitor-like YbhB/YbcL family protein